MVRIVARTASGKQSFALLALSWTSATSLALGAELQPECAAYLSAKQLFTPENLQSKLQRCTPNEGIQHQYAPNPRPSIPGATDTTDLSCRYGHPTMFGASEGTCCGWKPHFNWVVATCERGPNGNLDGNFCRQIPDGARDSGAKINYVAAYQFDGEHFVMVDDSTAGDLSPDGVSGSFAAGTGWERQKNSFSWHGGDWPTKYAPWGDGPTGPRGLTPPAMMWVLSAENFYYGAFYMLSQLTLNLEGHGNPTRTNCWNWEADPVEGAFGWFPPGASLRGNLNQLYSTNNAAVSGCMPVAYTARLANGLRQNFSQPEQFVDFCKRNPEEAGCKPWVEDVWWSGGVEGTQRFENLKDQAYVFAVVMDHQGIWIYRWIPDEAGKTGWSGLERTKAARIVDPRPRAVTDPRGLKSNVRGDVPEAVILQPSVPPEAACLRSSVEWVNWQFGADALGAMAAQLGEYGHGGKFEGAQNWWAHFKDTKQMQNYPLSICGVPKADLKDVYDCEKPGSYGEACKVREGGRRLRASTGSSGSSSNGATWV